jgi:homoserine dehydrogenase
VTRVGLLGFGTVGSAVARRLTAVDAFPHGIVLTHIFDRRAQEKRGRLSARAPIVWTSRIDDILQSDVDVVVEAVGGVEDAGAWVRGALLAGKSVVTANKQLVAHRGMELWSLASRQGRQLRFEAAVGGAMPIVRAIADGLAGGRVTRIDAILNGTTNAVLSAMTATGCSMHDALADARRNGYAEADPSADLRGDDARAKLAILCTLAFNLRIDPLAIPVRTTEAISASDVALARRRGGAIRQVAHAAFDRDEATLTAWVAPVVVPRESLLGRTAGPQNAAIVTCEYSGEMGMVGTGAGGDATAVAIVSDLVSIARDRAAVVPPPRLSSNYTLLMCRSSSELSVLNSEFLLAEAV